MFYVIWVAELTIWGRTSSPEGATGAPGGTYWGPRVIFRSKAAKVCPQRGFFSHFGEVFGGVLGYIIHAFLDICFFDEKSCFFENRCFT